MPDDTYTHGHQPSVLRSHAARTAENSAAYLIPRLTPDLEILDVGCGPGSITVDLADRVAPGRVVGIDRSDDVLGGARERAVGVDNVLFEVGDVYALAFGDDSFDVVHAHQVLQHLSAPVAALREMRRVCRPGGTIAVRDADYGAFVWAPSDDRLTRWLEVYRQVARSNGAEPDAGRRLKGWALEAGCTDVEASASVWCFADRAAQQWWGETWAERVTGSDLAAQVVERGLATRAELAEWAAAFEDWAVAPDGWFVVPHGEVLARP